jgi:hypothetical protein
MTLDVRSYNQALDDVQELVNRELIRHRELNSFEAYKLAHLSLMGQIFGFYKETGEENE